MTARPDQSGRRCGCSALCEDGTKACHTESAVQWASSLFLSQQAVHMQAMHAHLTWPAQWSQPATLTSRQTLPAAALGKPAAGSELAALAVSGAWWAWRLSQLCQVGFASCADPAKPRLVATGPSTELHNALQVLSRQCSRQPHQVPPSSRQGHSLLACQAWTLQTSGQLLSSTPPNWGERGPAGLRGHHHHSHSGLQACGWPSLAGCTAQVPGSAEGAL